MARGVRQAAGYRYPRTEYQEDSEQRVSTVRVDDSVVSLVGRVERDRFLFCSSLASDVFCVLQLSERGLSPGVVNAVCNEREWKKEVVVVVC